MLRLPLTVIPAEGSTSRVELRVRLPLIVTVWFVAKEVSMGVEAKGEKKEELLIVMAPVAATQTPPKQVAVIWVGLLRGLQGAEEGGLPEKQAD